jgi:hypothetical protein
MRYWLSASDSARWLAEEQTASQMGILLQEHLNRSPAADTLVVFLATGALACIVTATKVWRCPVPETLPDTGGR